MAVGLTFEETTGTASTDFTKVKIITLEDKTGNKYTLDISGGELELGYAPKTGNAIKYKVEGLGKAMESLFKADGSTASTPALAGAVAEAGVVDAIIGAPEFTNKVYTKTNNTDAVYTKTETDGAFAKKADVLSYDVSGTSTPIKDIDTLIGQLTTNADKAKKVYTVDGADKAFAQISGDNVDKTFAGKVLGAKDGDKFILVDTLGTALDQITDPDHKLYGPSSGKLLAKDFLGAKGLQGPVGPAGAPGSAANSDELKVDEDFQQAVATKMLQSSFDASGDVNTPLSWEF
ncbi:hypothetical protein [Wolbachia endosymbiont of Ctenocephalides felis wCfeT]|uniref:hypothetical protein n=1 Tax=Wolbachia endosymbiont of Ctenocephalides felis wCfeT TaxID=2732593 RepID=UPI0014464406|nr:hypothetical protein [Wolbachia endosymbiont of Ctenocephalides felis wCfeT]